MNKVYVIIEEYNVLHDDYLSYSETVGVAESHAAAESKIEKLKKKIITEAEANGLIAIDFTSQANCVVKVIADNGDILWRDIIEYEWHIEEYELIKES